MVIFSYEEDGYAHLFAYIPDQMPLTRLTSGDWDDITPCARARREKIAFASNRSGFWDLYLLDLSSGDVTQLTDTPEYEGAPTWSPDGSFMAFETYEDDNLKIVVGPANDPLDNAIRLTNSPASDHSPAWAPDGRHIAFISDGEVILADLDKTDGSRFQNLSNTELASESHPVWSPDGKQLAWASSATTLGRSGIYVWDATKNDPGDLGRRWKLARLECLRAIRSSPPCLRQTVPISRSIPRMENCSSPGRLSLRHPARIDLGKPGSCRVTCPQTFQQAANLTPAPLWAPMGEPVSEGTSSRWSLVDLEGVQAPYPQIA